MHSLDEDDRLLGQVSTWCLVLGGALAVLGGLALAAPWAAATVVDVFCGITMIAAGVSQLAMTAGTFTWRGFWLTLLCGALSIVAGTGMLVLPKAGVDALVFFLGLVLLFEAAAKLTAAFSLRGAFPWGWLLFDGLVTALLGGILLTSKPAEAGVLLGVFVGINLLSSAATFGAAGWWLRSAGRPA
jgi:uncharacterized membrane protein HdeD (DUF308 family)